MLELFQAAVSYNMERGEDSLLGGTSKVIGVGEERDVDFARD